MALNAQILLSILAHESDAGDISQTLRATPVTYALALTDGTGANESQVVWSDSLVITENSNQEVDLGFAQDERGTVVFSAIKMIYVRNASTETSIKITGVTQNGPWETGPLGTGEATIPQGGVAFFSNPTAGGWPVGAQPKELSILNLSAGGSGISATVDIVLIGEGTIT